MPAVSFITPHLFIIRDAPRSDRRANIQFHVEHGDYFGTLAAVLGLIEETGASPDTRRMLKRLRDDLRFLQDHYRIEKK